jgi:hypothetical protein
LPKNLANKYGIMFDITTKPVVIYANYRTGSSMLADYIAKKENLIRLSEPHVSRTDSIEVFEDCVTNHKINFVVKFMPDSIPESVLYQMVLDQHNFKIRLRRRDIVGQIASFYTAHITDRWLQRKSESVDNYSINIDTEHLSKLAERIIKNEILLEQSTLQFDLDLYYEDLGIVDAPIHVVTTKPENYDELAKVISELPVVKNYFANQ